MKRTPDPSRPHADNSIEQLAALDEWMQEQMRSLAWERESIQGELRLRTSRPPIPQPPQWNTSGLQYLTPAVEMAGRQSIGDEYADEAQRYGLRAGMLGGAVLIIVSVIIVILMVAAF